MTYKGFEIYANAKSYSLWTVTDDGKLCNFEHEYEGYDLISYIFVNDEMSGDEFGDFLTVNECKKAIDKLELLIETNV